MPDTIFTAQHGERSHARSGILRRGRNCWRIENATRAAFLIDGEAYFGAVRATLARATRSFYILGWDIDTRIKLVPGGAGDGLPDELGPFLNAIVSRHEGMQGYVLAWDYAMLYALEREWWAFLRFASSDKLSFRLDDRHPLGGSHHQKVIVVDDTVAFVSGFDLATSRWDTSEHACEHALRVNPSGGHYGPFHDVGIMVEGPVARALGELCRERWRRATSRAEEVRVDPPRRSPWPHDVAPDLTDVDVAIARTEPAYRRHPAVAEVRRLHLDAIAATRRFVFAENQYFTSTIVARALAQRLTQFEPPEVAAVGPATESGWLETTTMGVLRARMHAGLKAADSRDRYRMYCPAHPGDAPDPPCINVHSKLLVADDEFVTVGSANLSNRSMCLDTECNLAIEARGDPRIRTAIARLRARLLGEHLGVEPETVVRATREHGLHAGIALLSDRQRRHLRAIDPRVDPAVDAVVPDHEVLDPDRPLDPEVIIADLLPARRARIRVRTRLVVLIAGVLVAGALAVVWRYAGLSEIFSFERVVALGERVQESPWAPVVAILAYVAAGLLFLPLTLMIAVTAALFGPMEAIPISLAGALASGALTFGIGRRLERRVLHRIAGKRLSELARRLRRRGLLAVLLVRLLPVAPYTVVNLVAGASRIRWRDFLLGSALGLAPGLILTSTFVDRAIAAIVTPGSETFAMLALVLATIAALGYALRRKFGRVTPG
jgi:phosphatidylserine/phosphatidylglycerophosphate/cardiolipin synthase-like enzyme/uncharacterized membrane protein YdjX (TVP38/TMEM64 family)